MTVFTNGTDTVVANDRADIASVIESFYGSTMEQEGWSLDDWREVPDGKPITISNYDGNDNKLTLTAAEWAARDGRCFLCSTEW